MGLNLTVAKRVRVSYRAVVPSPQQALMTVLVYGKEHTLHCFNPGKFWNTTINGYLAYGESRVLKRSKPSIGGALEPPAGEPRYHGADC